MSQSDGDTSEEEKFSRILYTNNPTVVEDVDETSNSSNSNYTELVSVSNPLHPHAHNFLSLPTTYPPPLSPPCSPPPSLPPLDLTPPNQDTSESDNFDNFLETDYNDTNDKFGIPLERPPSRPMVNSPNNTELEEDYKTGWEWLERDPGPLIAPYLGFHQCLLDPLCVYFMRNGDVCCLTKPKDFFKLNQGFYMPSRKNSKVN